MSSRVGADLNEIEAVYRRSFPAFLKIATAIVGDEDVGADVVHDGFVAAVRARATFRREGPLEAWLWRAVVNAARMRLRSNRPIAALADDQPLASSTGGSATTGGSANGHSGDRGAALRAIIAALPERQRLALFLRYYADLDYGAIARVLEITPGTVAATLYAAHQAVKRALGEVRS